MIVLARRNKARECWESYAAEVLALVAEGDIIVTSDAHDGIIIILAISGFTGVKMRNGFIFSMRLVRGKGICVFEKERVVILVKKEYLYTCVSIYFRECISSVCHSVCGQTQRDSICPLSALSGIFAAAITAQVPRYEFSSVHPPLKYCCSKSLLRNRSNKI